MPINGIIKVFRPKLVVGGLGGVSIVFTPFYRKRIAIFNYIFYLVTRFANHKQVVK